MFRKIFVDYDFNEVFDTDWYKYKHSCKNHQKVELKDIHDTVGGFPESYSDMNTMFYQKFFREDEIDFKNLGEQLQIEPITVSAINLPPGMTNPLHRDTFYQVKKRFPERANENIVRANIFLEDWKWGHFLQFNDEVVTHWKKNTGYLWDSSVLHLAVNAGLENRFTLQVSGFYYGV